MSGFGWRIGPDIVRVWSTVSALAVGGGNQGLGDGGNEILGAERSGDVGTLGFDADGKGGFKGVSDQE